MGRRLTIPAGRGIDVGFGAAKQARFASRFRHEASSVLSGPGRRTLVVRPVIIVAALGTLLLSACERREPSVPAPPTSPEADQGPPAAEKFAAVRSASLGKARVYGSYTRGCIAGAEQLPLESPRWQVLHPSRNRAWGHPALIAFVHRLADDLNKDGVRGLLIGDLGQPRGGPSPTDHNSHQVGLDVDIWLTTMPAKKLDANELENYDPPSMVDLDTLKVNSYFAAAQTAMLKRAAMSHDVERIFVSPPIKRAMCESATGDRTWLRKIRPWTGHMAHMHVRLGCPIDSDDCTEQEPPPEGDGCGAELQSWFNKPGWARPSIGRYEPEKALRLKSLPAACQRLLTDRG
jgi:penicillin-insensitive murein DD-endopeptidase